MFVSKRKRNCEKWQDHMDSWERSDISQKEYCLGNGLKYQTFLFWRRQLKKGVENKRVSVVQLKDKININSFIKPSNGFSTIKISFGEFSMEFDSHISSEVLTGIVNALKSI